MKRLLAIFPPGENVHLVKDLGLIPYTLQQNFNYNSVFACYQNGTYPYLDNEVKGLKVSFVKRVFNNETFDVLLYLLLNYRKHDVLLVFQFIRKSWIAGVFFKALKLGKGKVYLKLDADDNIYDYNPTGIKKFISDFIFSKIDLISVENRRYARYLNEKMILGKTVEYIPNGYYDKNDKEATKFIEKRNLIVTVGRIGTVQKATEILCTAFQKFAESNSDWQLEVIGPIENGFHIFIDQYFDKFPSLVPRVKFTGSILDRKQLERKYREAKIFALTSRWEGFPLVFLEAIHHGCYIISTDIPAAYDVTGQEVYGKLFPIDDHHNLAEILIETCSNQSKLEVNCDLAQKFARRNFNWLYICEEIDNLLN